MNSAGKENQILSGNSQIDGLYHTVEWLITAFAGTLVFIIFVMQVYRIPTGSMAETLRGAHFRIRCTQCGYRFDHDFIARNYPLPGTFKPMPDTFTPRERLPVVPRSPVCPSCGFAEKDPRRANNGQYFVFDDNRSVPAEKHTVFKGDQIFVIKSIYQFFEPKRWDVIVFKNPREPRINYIKRCIGLPGETVQLIEGDVFINGQIARKPDKAQEELWMLVYDNDHQPARPREQGFYEPLSGTEKLPDLPGVKLYDRVAWKQPFEKVGDSAWDLGVANGTVFELSSSGQDVQRIRYNDRLDTGFRAAYAYDDPAGYRFMPTVNDLMIQYYAVLQTGSAAGAQIRYRGIIYQGQVGANGSMQIGQVTDGQFQILAERTVAPVDQNRMIRFRLASVDQQIVLEFGSSKLVFDLGSGIDLAERSGTPEIQITGTGKVQLRHVAVYRDIHYTLVDTMGRAIVNAAPDKPMRLDEGEYFACGDNSPASFDSRFWGVQGLANAGQEPFKAGIVPHDYLVGKAFFVHWPGGYRPEYETLNRFPVLKFLYGIRWIPYVDGMKPIYGGKR